MLTETQKAKAKELLSSNLADLKAAVDIANDAFNEYQSAEELASHFEDIAVEFNGVTQVVGLLGYQEMLDQDYKPLGE